MWQTYINLRMVTVSSLFNTYLMFLASPVIVKVTCFMHTITLCYFLLVLTHQLHLSYMQKCFCDYFWLIKTGGWKHTSSRVNLSEE